MEMMSPFLLHLSTGRQLDLRMGLAHYFFSDKIVHLQNGTSEFKLAFKVFQGGVAAFLLPVLSLILLIRSLPAPCRS